MSPYVSHHKGLQGRSFKGKRTFLIIMIISGLDKDLYPQTKIIFVHVHCRERPCPALHHGNGQCLKDLEPLHGKSGYGFI